MTEFNLLGVKETSGRITTKLTAEVEISGKKHKVPVILDNFMDGTCNTRFFMNKLDVDEETRRAIAKAIADEHFRQITEGENDVQ